MVQVPWNKLISRQQRGRFGSSIPKFRIRFWHPINKILQDIGKAFERDGDMLQVTGLPLKVFCFRKPEHIEQIFKDQRVGGIKNPKLLPRLTWAMPRSGVILKGGQEWRERRRQLQGAFKADMLRQYASLVPELTAEMLDRWKTYENDPNGFDLSREMHNLITRLAFRMYFSEDLDGELLETMAQQAHYVEYNFVRRMPLWVPTPQNLKFRRCVKNLQRTFQRLIDRRRATPAAPQDLLSAMVNLQDAETGEPWPDHEIVAETFNVFIATCLLGTSLSWSFHLLATNPTVQQKLRDEAQTVLGKRPPTIADLDNLPYSELVLMEILRLFPSSWGLPRLCEQGMTIDGHQIPPGSMVIPMVYFTQRHPELWDEPDEFRPERFAAENRKEIHPCAYFPFGRGERTCLGVNLAPMILRPMLSAVCQRYQLEFKPQSANDPVADFAFEIHPRDPMRMKLTKK